MKRPVIIALLSVLLASSCRGSPVDVAPPPPIEIPTDVFAVPLANPKIFPGCDYGDKPCASGQNGTTPGYHTGIDYSGNKEILASGPGIVVLKQIDGQQDHRMGNTVILMHMLPDGRPPIYTLYAHLAKIYDDVVVNRCLEKGHPIGVMGGSGGGDPNRWPVHLHFEFKTSPVLGDPKSDKYWGYIAETETDPNPGSWGYENPNDYIDKETTMKCEGTTSIPSIKPPPTSTIAVTRTPPAPGPTPTRKVTPTATVTLVPCTDNGSKYIADVTIPDGTVVKPGEKFVKTWRLMNNGQCAWVTGYRLVHISGSLMDAPEFVDVPRDVKPGEEVDISVTFTAPQEPGLHKSTWQMQDNQGNLFGAKPYAEIHSGASGIERITGVWRGIVTQVGGDIDLAPPSEQSFEIRSSCQTGAPCLDGMIPLVITPSRDPNTYCFSSDSYIYQCFQLQPNGTLSYTWASGFATYAGILYKVGE